MPASEPCNADILHWPLPLTASELLAAYHQAKEEMDRALEDIEPHDLTRRGPGPRSGMAAELEAT